MELIYIFLADPVAEPPINVEEAVRFNSMSDVMRKNFVPSKVIGLIGLLAASIIYGQQGLGSSLYDNENSLKGIMILFICGAFLMAVNLLIYKYWHKKSKEKIANGGKCIPIGVFNILQNTLLFALLVAAIAGMVFS